MSRHFLNLQLRNTAIPRIAVAGEQPGRFQPYMHRGSVVVVWFLWWTLWAEQQVCSRFRSETSVFSESSLAELVLARFGLWVILQILRLGTVWLKGCWY